MTEVYVTRSPSTSDDNGMGMLAFVIIFALVFFGVIAYANGWLSGNREVPANSDTGNITITTPATQVPALFPSRTPSTSTQSAPSSSLD